MNKLQWTNETHFFIKIYLSLILFSKGAHSLRVRWREIYSERGLLLAPYLLPGARGCQRLHSLASCIIRDASDWLHIPGSTLDSHWTDCLNLTAWFSYHVVSFRLHTCLTCLPRCTVIPLSTNHNMTACQSTRGHQERTQNPCQQSLYNTFCSGIYVYFCKIMFIAIIYYDVFWVHFHQV